jgi:putative RecB family exonuclease
VATYSHSRLETFEQCPQKYKFRYIDNLKTDKRTIEAFLGSCVHQALEKLYADRRAGRVDSLDDLLAGYEQRWQQGFGPDVEVVRAGRTPEDYFRSGREMLEKFYRRFHPFDQEATLDLELRINFPLADGADFTGVVDRLARNGDGTLEIHDYKTAQKLPSQREVESDRQLALYELAVRHRWPDTGRVRLVWHYLAHETELVATKTPAQLEAVRAGTLQLIRRVEAAREFPPRETKLCDWCEYYGICPAKQPARPASALPLASPDAEITDLVDRFVALREARRQNQELLDALEVQILDYASRIGASELAGSRRKVRVREWTETKLPSKSEDQAAYGSVEALLVRSGAWDRVSKLDSGKVVEALEAGDLPADVARELEPYLRRETRRSLTVARLDREEE